MLSYIHAYHAGNHADILKHLTISLILERLTQKTKPFTVFDTHSGSALYYLDDDRLKRTGEAESGILRLKTAVEKEESGELKKISESGYFSIASSFLKNGTYPGSPLIENHYLRPGDVQILSELHPQVFDELKSTFAQLKKDRTGSTEPQIHRRDGYEMLEALTPPEIKRGLAVIDPSFEDRSDFEKCGRTIAKIIKKWPVGIIALWYPLISHRSMEISEMKEMIAAAVRSEEPKILDVQLCVKKSEDMTGLASLYGSGMYIVNAPYQLDEELSTLLPALCETLKETEGSWSVEKR